MLTGALVQHLDVMILDELVNLLDILELFSEAARQFANYSCSVPHDCDFVNVVCGEIIILHRSNLSACEKGFEK